MIEQDALSELSLSGLAEVIGSQAPIWAGEHPDRWRFVLELFTSRLASASRQTITRQWLLLRDAHEALIESAHDDEAISDREAVVCKVNMLVALASELESSAAVDELATSAKRLFLENVPMSLERVQEMDWRALPMGEVRAMRYIKNLLIPLRGIASHGLNQADNAEVDAWLEVLPSLP